MGQPRSGGLAQFERVNFIFSADSFLFSFRPRPRQASSSFILALGGIWQMCRGLIDSWSGLGSRITRCRGAQAKWKSRKRAGSLKAVLGLRPSPGASNVTAAAASTSCF